MEDRIIKLYLSGYGSPAISKKLSIPKRKVLKILNKKNLIKKNITKEYKDFKYDGDRWYHFYVCDTCENKIECYAQKKYLLHRNIKNKKTCKKCSLDKQKGEGNPFYGKKHSDDTIKKIKAKSIGVRRSDHMSKPKYKKMFSDMKKKLWLSGKMEETRKKLSEIMRAKHRNGELKSFNISKAEIEIVNKLKNEGIECIHSFRIDSKIFDIYLPKYNLLIEYNGDYWHCNPIKYKSDYFNHKKNKTASEIWEYDKNKLYLAEKEGYYCEVIWETDYKKNKNLLFELIKNYEKN
ncbi:MAG: NUMOD3 domain-containing DNA-binding protein [Promethearchaeota archaeon]